MGLAASQARLLTITARLADNELRSQTINNAKMRLATQSAQASEDYVNALNNARLMFTNIDSNGLSQTQVLNFNNLTAYSPYNTQYGLVNSAGLALVGETEAKLYQQANGDLNAYLESHGLEWETTYFDDKYDEYGNELNNIQAKLQSFYGTDSTTSSSGTTLYDLGYLFDDLDYDSSNGNQATNADFKALYEMYDANQLSIERTTYNGLAQVYYNELKGLYDATALLFREDILGKDKNEDDIIESILNTCTTPADIRHELRYCDMGSDLKLGLKDANRYLSENGQIKVGTILESINGYPSGNVDGVSTTTTTYTTTTTETTIETVPLEYSEVDGNYVWVVDGKITFTSNPSQTAWIGDEPIGVTKELDEYGQWRMTYDPSDNFVYHDENAYPVDYPLTTGVHLFSMPISYIINHIYTADGSSFYRYDPITNTIQRYTDIEKEVVVTEEIEVQEQEENLTRDKLKEMLEEYFHALLDTRGYFEPYNYAMEHKGEGIKGLEAFEEIYNKFTTIYGIDVGSEYPLLIDFKKLMQSEVEDIYGNKDKAGLLGTEEFHNVVDAYKIDLMVDVMGEPKYTWVDHNDKTNTGNAETKAQWYTNLFKRMEQGYKILEDGLASSSKWLEYAFESGLVGLEQVDKSYNWNALSYNTCSSISEESDSSEAVAVAEAKYKRAMNDIEQKDKMYDLQLKNIDTEHNSLQTEYDSIEKVISKNIERTMKFDQSA